MFRTLLRSKIHRATVTHCELHYEGSCGIDQDLLDASDIRSNEQVHIWNVNNGERFITYAIPAPRDSGVVSLNGSAARRAAPGATKRPTSWTAPARIPSGDRPTYPSDEGQVSA